MSPNGTECTLCGDGLEPMSGAAFEALPPELKSGVTRYLQPVLRP